MQHAHSVGIGGAGPREVPSSSKNTRIFRSLTQDPGSKQFPESWSNSPEAGTRYFFRSPLLLVRYLKIVLPLCAGPQLKKIQQSASAAPLFRYRYFFRSALPLVRNSANAISLQSTANSRNSAIPLQLFSLYSSLHAAVRYFAISILQFAIPQFAIPQFAIPQFAIPQFAIPQYQYQPHYLINSSL